MVENSLKINLLLTMKQIRMEIKINLKDKKLSYSNKEKKCKMPKEDKINGMPYSVDLFNLCN